MKRLMLASVGLFLAGIALSGCGSSAQGQATGPVAPAAGLPPGEPQAVERLTKSTRHGEYVQVTIPGQEKPMRAYIVHPERADKAPVVMVIMEIFGMSDWLRATTDQLAADGFIAIAPDFLDGKGPNGGPVALDQARTVIGTVQVPEVMTKLNATRDYALKLPNGNGKVAVMGFCWGGTQTFNYAINQPALAAGVVFYGTPPATGLVPDEAQLTKIKAPLAGFFGQNDNRVTSLVAPTQEAMKKLNKPYDAQVYAGAGHGFVRQQTGPATTDANLKATQQAWPAALKFLREHTK